MELMPDFYIWTRDTIYFLKFIEEISLTSIILWLSDQFLCEMMTYEVEILLFKSNGHLNGRHSGFIYMYTWYYIFVMILEKISVTSTIVGL